MLSAEQQTAHTEYQAAVAAGTTPTADQTAANDAFVAAQQVELKKWGSGQMSDAAYAMAATGAVIAATVALF